MSTIKKEMLSVEDVSAALKISKSQVYKVLKRNKNIIKPMIKVDGKTFISNEGIEYIEEVFNKSITSISLNSDDMNISLEEVAVTSNTVKSYKNKSLEDVKLNNLAENPVKKVSTSKEKINVKKDTTLSKNTINAIKNNEINSSKNIYVAPLNFKGKTILQDEKEKNNVENIQNLTQEQRLKLEEEKLLEKHCREVDTKLINLKERLIEKQELNKKGFFKKVIDNIFKK